MLCLFRKIAGAMWILGQTFFLRAAARSFAWFRLCCVQISLLPCRCCKLSASLFHQQDHSRGLPVDYRSEGRLIQSPPGRGSEPCRFNPESRVTGGVSVFFLYGFSLIVRLVSEVIKITRGVLAWGFSGVLVFGIGGVFGFFLLLLRKCPISFIRDLFALYSFLRSLIF